MEVKIKKNKIKKVIVAGRDVLLFKPIKIVVSVVGGGEMMTGFFLLFYQKTSRVLWSKITKKDKAYDNGKKQTKKQTKKNLRFPVLASWQKNDNINLK